MTDRDQELEKGLRELSPTKEPGSESLTTGFEFPGRSSPIFNGLVGEMVDVYKGCTEAAPETIAVQFLVACGSLFDRGPYFKLGREQRCNEFLLLIGPSAIGRKGESLDKAQHIPRLADPEWYANSGGGLTSGEGLIDAVRDEVVATTPKGKEYVKHPSVDDKRLFAKQSEFAAVLKQGQRHGNILAETLCDFWDGEEYVRSRSKGEPRCATGAHVSIVAHSTPEDIREFLTERLQANGFANRFVTFYSKKCCDLPIPGDEDSREESKLADHLAAIVEKARREPVRYSLSKEALRLWEQEHKRLSEPPYPGLVQAMLARSAAHAIRFAMIYAVLGGSKDYILLPHLESALAVMAYSEASVLHLWKGRSGDKRVDKVRELTAEPGSRISLSEIQAAFGKHLYGQDLTDVVNDAVALGGRKIETKKTGGRDLTELVNTER